MDSPLVRLDPRAKLAAFVVAVGAIAALQTIPAVTAALAAAFALYVWARLPMDRMIYRLGLVLLAVVPVVALLPIFSGYDGLNLAAMIALKALAISATALELAGGSTAHSMAWAARQFGVPRTLVRMALLSQRFGHVLGGEMRQMQTAARVRGFRSGFRRHSLRTTGTLVGTLMIRSVSRAERVVQVLQCRGDLGQVRLLDTPHFGWRDGAFVVIAAALAALLLVWDYRLAN